jgi:flagellar biogenesis protein FliO
MKQDGNAKTMLLGGVADWLQGRLRRAGRVRSRLELVERITLAPRHSLALVEAEGRRFLVATSPEGAPSFYPLDERTRSRSAHGRGLGARVSW